MHHDFKQFKENRNKRSNDIIALTHFHKIERWDKDFKNNIESYMHDHRFFSDWLTFDIHVNDIENTNILYFIEDIKDMVGDHIDIDVFCLNLISSIRNKHLLKYALTRKKDIDEYFFYGIYRNFINLVDIFLKHGLLKKYSKRRLYINGETIWRWSPTIIRPTIKMKEMYDRYNIDHIKLLPKKYTPIYFYKKGRGRYYKLKKYKISKRMILLEDMINTINTRLWECGIDEINTQASYMVIFDKIPNYNFESLRTTMVNHSPSFIRIDKDILHESISKKINKIELMSEMIIDFLYDGVVFIPDNKGDYISNLSIEDITKRIIEWSAAE